MYQLPLLSVPVGGVVGLDEIAERIVGVGIRGVNLPHGPNVVFIDDGHIVKTAAALLSAKFINLPAKVVAGGVQGGQRALQGGGVVAVFPGIKAVGVGGGGRKQAVINHGVRALQSAFKNGCAVALHNIIRAALYAVHMQGKPGLGHAGIGGHGELLVGKGVGAPPKDD